MEYWKWFYNQIISDGDDQNVASLFRDWNKSFFSLSFVGIQYMELDIEYDSSTGVQQMAIVQRQ